MVGVSINNPNGTAKITIGTQNNTISNICFFDSLSILINPTQNPVNDDVGTRAKPKDISNISTADRL
ncbi:MAG: hypothetical protein ACI4HK_06435 [Ruminococcus sp.]